jgi:transcription elongation factor Elf1
MGRRKKAAKKVAKKKKASVARTFKCLFCNHEDVVSCRLDMKSMTGTHTYLNVCIEDLRTPQVAEIEL